MKKSLSTRDFVAVVAAAYGHEGIAFEQFDFTLGIRAQQIQGDALAAFVVKTAHCLPTVNYLDQTCRLVHELTCAQNDLADLKKRLIQGAILTMAYEYVEWLIASKHSEPNADRFRFWANANLSGPMLDKADATCQLVDELWDKEGTTLESLLSELRESLSMPEGLALPEGIQKEPLFEPKPVQNANSTEPVPGPEQGG